MNNFFRAVRLALRHRLTILFVLASSLVVGVLWGANIGTLYPIVEVVFQRKSLDVWVHDQIADHSNKLERHQRDLKLLQRAAVDADVAGRRSLSRRAGTMHSRIEAETQAVATMEWLKPSLVKYAPRDPFQTLLVVVVIIFLGTLLKNLFLVANVIMVERLAQLSTFDLRKRFYRRTLRMDLGAFGEDRTAGLMSRFTNDMNALSGGISMLFGKVLREPIKMSACLIGATFICWRLLLLSLVITPLAVYLVAKLSQSIKRANRRAMEEMANLYGVLSETFTGIQAVKAYTMERHERNRFHQTSKTYFRRAMRIITYNALTRPATELMGMAVICSAISAGGYLVLNEQTHVLGIKMSDRPLTFGALMTFYALLIGASDPARKLADVVHALQASAAGADRIFEMLDREPAIVEVNSPAALPAAFNEVEFQNVSFAYVPDQQVLKDINLRIRRGECLAIVGPNGCGKSTLANLLSRFYDPNSGSICFDGINLRDVRLRDLRNRIGLVTQQTLLFDDTIMNNIRYGSPGASDEQVMVAAKKAHADRFIEEQLEHGFQTIVGERGGKLSGGQRQRIALARAILRDPEILILDEATSQIDIESEQLIHHALSQFIKGRTSLMITHRISTIALSDRVVVMEKGGILDIGTHEELMRRCALYQRLQKSSLKESA